MLGKAEQYFAEIIKVPAYKARINSLIFMNNYEHDKEELNENIKQLTGIWETLSDNKVLEQFLTLILAIGNYLEGQSVRGGAHGFKIDILERLKEFKTVDRKIGLLEYVINKLEVDQPGLNIDMQYFEMQRNLLDFGVKFQISQLETDLRDLKNKSS